MFSQQTAEMIALALEERNHELANQLVCRECRFGWRAPDPYLLQNQLKESDEPRQVQIAPWINVVRMVLHDEERLLQANSSALKMIYGLPPERLMADFSIVHYEPIEKDLVRMLMPLFDGKRSHFVSVDRVGNLIIER